MLLEDAGPEGHCRNRHGNIKGVVGQTDRKIKSLRQMRDRPQVHLLWRRRIWLVHLSSGISRRLPREGLSLLHQFPPASPCRLT